jgi:3-deoxy-manno-octulosonate cytidylyltransferase (CMP-KDO synthetase)
MNDRPKVIGVIPVRLGSTRLPGKVLITVAGKALVHWVYDAARQSPLLNELLVATDSPEVQRYCSLHEMPAIATREHPSGSDRLYEVMERTDGDIYVNIQGDEPTIRVEHLALLIGPLLSGTCEVTTLGVAIDEAAAQDPGCVKVVTDARGRALYFSRQPIPFFRDSSEKRVFYKHIGLYGYTRAALNRFHSLPQGRLELAEKLEQLRFLENGIAIAVLETAYDTIGVDTEADLKKAVAFLTAR